LLKLALSWVLYQIGDISSRIGRHVDSYALWWLYQTVMGWSVALDPAGKIWKFPEDKGDSS
jgi:hypothetical protein